MQNRDREIPLVQSQVIYVTKVQIYYMFFNKKSRLVLVKVRPTCFCLAILRPTNFLAWSKCWSTDFSCWQISNSMNNPSQATRIVTICPTVIIHPTVTFQDPNPLIPHHLSSDENFSLFGHTNFLSTPRNLHGL